MGTKLRLALALAMVASLFSTTLTASAQDDFYQDFGTDEFYEVWERTDYPVQQLVEARTWIWGPGAITGLLEEYYEEADDNTRLVQYTDKSRMEMPWDGGDPDSPWFITQGLLATELMTGNLQLGDDTFQPYAPANIPVAGDPDDATGPTYATMGQFMDWDPRPTGATITQFMGRYGDVSDLDHLATYGVTDEYYVPETDHNIASVFWEFMTSTATIYEGGQFVEGDLFRDAFYAVGFPTTEAYWGWVKVDGVEQNVLIQCFERRCLTYTPDNPEGWQVESGNIGQHYYHWRYDILDVDESGQPDEPEEPAAESFAVSPSSATNQVGETHEITVSVEDQYDDPFEGADVSAEVTDGPNDGTDLEPDDATTGSDGEVTLSYEGDEEGTDTITVSVDGIEDNQTVTKTWEAAPEPELSLALAQDEDMNEAGTTHEFTATLTADDADLDIDDEDDVEVSIVRDDAPEPLDPIDDIDIDVVDNVATISYTGPDDAAEDAIDVTVDVDGTDVVGEPTLTKTWCDAVVSDGESIQDAIDDADEGDLICVEEGTYDEDVSVDVEGLTLLGVNDADSDDAAVIDGSVSLDADGTEVRSIVVTHTGDVSSDTVDPFGIRVVASDTVVADNIVRDLTADDTTVNGIQVFGDDAISNITVEDNVVTNFQNDGVHGVAGIKLQADLDDVDVTGNTVTDLHSAGWVWGIVMTGSGSAGDEPTNVLVEGNTMERLNDGTEFPVFATGSNLGRDEAPYPGGAFGIDEGASADEVTLEYNNLLAPNGAENKDDGTSLEAECNWWGSDSGPDNDDPDGPWAYENDGPIDYEPWLVAPAPDGECSGMEP